MLVLEIAAGIVLGVFACAALVVLPGVISAWYKERRWWRGFKKHERMVTKLSRRYSRHLLEEDGVKLPWRVDALERFMPIDQGEEEFDPVAMARIRAFAIRVDGWRDQTL